MCNLSTIEMMPSLYRNYLIGCLISTAYTLLITKVGILKPHYVFLSLLFLLGSSFEVLSCQANFEDSLSLDNYSSEKIELSRQIRSIEKYSQACMLAEALADEARHLDAAEAFDRASALASNDTEKGQALHRQALMYFYGDVMDRAMQLFQKTADIGEQTDNLSLQIEALSGQAGIMTELGKRLEAANQLKQAIQLGKKLHGEIPDESGRRQLLRMHYNMAIAYRMVEQTDGLKTTLADTKDYLSQNDPPFMYGYFGQLSGVLARLEGDFETSIKLLEVAYKNLDSAPSTLFKLNLLYELILTYQALEDGENALAKSSEMMQLAEILDPPLEFILPKTYEAHARALLTSGQPHAAAGQFLAAYQLLKTEQQQRLASELLWLNDLYEKEVRSRELEMLRQDGEIKDLIITQQTYVVALTFLLAVVFIIWGVFWTKRRKEREAFQAQLSIIEAQRDERLQISREIHDSILQGVIAISIQSQRAWNWSSQDSEKMLDALTKIRELSESTAREGRHAIERYRSEFRSSNLTQLISEVKDATGNHPLLIELPTKDSAAWSYCFPHDVNAICIEALRNSIKHAEASSITLAIHYANDLLDIYVKDNGKGFDFDGDYLGHWGLVGMKERAKLIGATLDIQSDRDGTVLKLTVGSLSQ